LAPSSAKRSPTPSSASQATPSIPPPTTPTHVSAAAVAQKIAYFGFDEWDIRRVTEQVVTYAVVADEGFAWPYWDASIPPFVKDESGEVVGLGDIRIEVLGANEVGWEPGVRYEDARWYVVRRAMSEERVKALPDSSREQRSPPTPAPSTYWAKTRTRKTLSWSPTT
jgi:hypothetical protein